tara:strand:- start:130 stop:564 length:435 start_codon:yes stop_codon:yes gene_type:complete
MAKRRTKKQLDKIKSDPYSVYWKKKALILWGKIIRKRDDKCLYCGTKKGLNAHHLLPKERYPLYMFELSNGFTLCTKNHKYGNPSAHKHGLWFSKFLREKYPKILAWAESRVYNYGKLEKKINYKKEHDRLEKLYDGEYNGHTK